MSYKNITNEDVQKSIDLLDANADVTRAVINYETELHRARARLRETGLTEKEIEAFVIKAIERAKSITCSRFYTQ